MAAGTSIKAIERPAGQVNTGEFTADLGSIAAGGREEVTVAVPGAKVGDVVHVSPQDVLTTGIAVGHARVSSAGNISFYVINYLAAGSVDQASGKWNYAIFRGSTRRLA